MSKVKLLGMVTESYYIDDEWKGANIRVLMEADGHRLEISLTIRCDLLTLSQLYGYEDIERLVMKRVENGLDKVQKEYKAIPKDINTIYEVVRLKMPRFVHKSALKIFYFWNAVTGEIREE